MTMTRWYNSVMANWCDDTMTMVRWYDDDEAMVHRTIVIALYRTIALSTFLHMRCLKKMAIGLHCSLQLSRIKHPACLY